MVNFHRFPCPVCGELRADNESGCAECGWRKVAAPPRSQRIQFNLITMFDLMIIVGFISLAIRSFLWLGSVMGFEMVLAFLTIMAILLSPFVALYRWYSGGIF